jgi:hypothetical protein
LTIPLKKNTLIPFVAWNIVPMRYLFIKLRREIIVLDNHIPKYVSLMKNSGALYKIFSNNDISNLYPSGL